MRKIGVWNHILHSTATFMTHAIWSKFTEKELTVYHNSCAMIHIPIGGISQKCKWMYTFVWVSWLSSWVKIASQPHIHKYYFWDRFFFVHCNTPASDWIVSPMLNYSCRFLSENIIRFLGDSWDAQYYSVCRYTGSWIRYMEVLSPKSHQA